MEITKGKIGNALTSTASDHVVAVAHDIYDETQERYQDDINNYALEQIFEINQALCCFNTGLWENELHWSNVALWDNNKFAITEDLQTQITELDRISDEHSDALAENILDHQVFRIQLQDQLDKLMKLESLATEHDNQLLDLLDALSCFGEGQWHNDLKWSNKVAWENSNLMCDTFEDIYLKIEEHQKALENLNKAIISVKEDATATLNTINETFTLFRQEHEDFKKEHSTFREEHQAIGKRIDEVISHQDNIDNLNKEQQRQIDILLLNSSLIAFGIWDNNLLWVNESEWNNYKGIGEGQDRIDDLYNKLEEANKEIFNNTLLIEENRNYTGINRNDILQCISDIVDNAEAIESNSDAIADNARKIDELQQDAVTKHRNFAYQLRAIGRDQAEQDENLLTIGSHFGCFVDGLWGNLFVWDNGHLWANEPGVVKSAIDDIHVQLDTHEEKLNSIIEETDEHFTCFSDDVWCNLSVWDNGRLWSGDSSNLIQAIQKNQETINALSESVKDFKTQTHNEIATINSELSQVSEEISEASSAIQSNHKLIDENTQNIGNITTDIQKIDKDVDTLQKEAIDEHRQVAYQFRAVTREQAAQDENISKLGEHFGCFVDGLWGNLFVWDNGHLWANEPGVVAEIQEELSSQDARLTALETALAQLLEINKMQQAHIEKQQSQLDALLDVFTVNTVGLWQNPLLWDDSAQWSNILITEQIGNSNSGSSEVVVKSYDATTGTLEI